MKKLTQKELAARWGVCLRTVQREVRRWRLNPIDYTGIQPLFSEFDVEDMEAKRRKERMNQFGFPQTKVAALQVKAGAK